MPAVRAAVTSGPARKPGTTRWNAMRYRAGMFDDQCAEDRNTDGHEILDRVTGRVERRDVVGEELERALGQRVDQQAFLRSEQAVDGPCRRADLGRDRSHGERSGSALGDQAFGGKP